MDKKCHLQKIKATITKNKSTIHNNSNEFVPAAGSLVQPTWVLKDPTAATMPGPGQIPDIPQPQPNSRPPMMRRGSTTVLVGMLNFSASSGRGGPIPRSTAWYPTMATAMAEPMTKGRDQSQEGSRGVRKPTTLVGRVMPHRPRPRENVAPTATSLARFRSLRPREGAEAEEAGGVLEDARPSRASSPMAPAAAAATARPDCSSPVVSATRCGATGAMPREPAAPVRLADSMPGGCECVCGGGGHAREAGRQHAWRVCVSASVCVWGGALP